MWCQESRLKTTFVVYGANSLWYKEILRIGLETNPKQVLLCLIFINRY